MVDDAHAVRQHVGLLEVLGGEEDGHAAVARQALHLLPERAAALHVEPRGGLVEEQDARAVDERQRQVEPALHAARVAAHAAVRRLHEPDALEQRVGALARLRPGHAVQSGLKLHVLAAGQERVERGLLERRPDRGAHLVALLDHVVAGHPRAPRRGRQQRGEHVDRRGLPGAVRPEEAVDLAGLHAQVDPVNRARPLLELANELLRFDRGLGHAPSLPTGSGARRVLANLLLVMPGLVLRRRRLVRQVREVLDAAHAVHLARAVHERVHLLAVRHLAAEVDHAVLDIHGDVALGELLVAEDLALDLAGEGGVVEALLGGRASGAGVALPTAPFAWPA